MPVLGVPDNFVIDEKRQKREAVTINGPRRGVAVYYTLARRGRADVYVMLKFDGTIQDISAINVDIEIKFYNSPTLKCAESTVDFDPGSDKLIRIKVSCSS